MAPCALMLRGHAGDGLNQPAGRALDVRGAVFDYVLLRALLTIVVGGESIHLIDMASRANNQPTAY